MELSKPGIRTPQQPTRQSSENTKTTSNALPKGPQQHPIPFFLVTKHSYIFSRAKNLIISGSFDRTIKIWDLQSNNAAAVSTLSLADSAGPKASIYSLATDPTGHVIAAGSPERVVRIWDPRSSKRAGKVLYHFGLVQFNPD